MARTSPDVIRLNVGGAKYEVSRSLIDTYPTTMLARMVSETWHQDSSNEIFVDRNGQRFQYVLDYMRDQKVCLPMGVSTASIVKELDYFGFENVPADAIDGSVANWEAAEHVKMVYGEYKDSIEKLEESMRMTEIERDLAMWAHRCYQEFMCTGKGRITFKEANEKSYKPAFQRLNFDRKGLSLECFKSKLAKYGLKMDSYKFTEQDKLTHTDIGKMRNTVEQVERIRRNRCRTRRAIFSRTIFIIIFKILVEDEISLQDY